MVLSLPEVSPEGAGDRMTAAQVQRMDQFCLMLFPHNYNNAWTRVSAIYKCQMNEVRKSPRAMERSFHLLDSLRCTVPHDLLGLCTRKILLAQGRRAAVGWSNGSCLSVSFHDFNLHIVPSGSFPKVSIWKILHRYAYE